MSEAMKNEVLHSCDRFRGEPEANHLAAHGNYVKLQDISGS
jgi:hypothetical protein